MIKGKKRFNIYSLDYCLILLVCFFIAMGFGKKSVFIFFIALLSVFIFIMSILLDIPK